MNRQQLLERAASLDPRAYAGNQLISQRQYERACNLNWAPWNGLNGVQLDDPEAEIPVLDPLTLMPVNKNDVVMLSDGLCYSRESMQRLLNEGIVRLATGRANLPLSGDPLTDLDYALLGAEPPTLSTTAAARARTSEVAMQAYRTSTTDEQREFERLRRQGLTTSQAVAEQVRLRQEGGDTFDNLPAPEEHLAAAIEAGDNELKRRLVRSTDEENAVFDYEIATNDQFLKRLSDRISDTSDPVNDLIDVLLALPDWGERFSISTLANLFTADDMNVDRQILLSVNWMRLAPRLFALDANVEKYVGAVAQAQVDFLINNGIDLNAEEVDKDIVNELISNIYERNITDKIRIVPNIVQAYMQPFEEQYGANYETKSEVDRIRQQVKQHWSTTAVLNFLQLDFPLYQAVDQQDIDRIDELSRQVAGFRDNDISANNQLLVRLSILEQAIGASYGVYDVLNALPDNASNYPLFDVSVLADLYEPGNKGDAVVVLNDNLLRTKPRLFRLDTDLDRLEKYAGALANASLEAREDDEPDSEIYISLLVDLMALIYSRGQSTPQSRTALVADAFMQRIEANDRATGRNEAPAVRARIEEARRVIRNQYETSNLPPSRRQSARIRARQTGPGTRDNPL